MGISEGRGRDGRVASITGQARSTLTRENGQPTDSNLAQPSSGHSVKSPHTDLCLSFLIFEPPRSQFRPDHTFPTTNLCFRATALIVAASDLPCQSAVRLYLGDVLVAEGWIIARFQGENGVFWRCVNERSKVTRLQRLKVTHLSGSVLHADSHFGRDRLEAACARAIEINACSYSSLHSILKNGLDRQPRTRAPDEPAITHPNIRGAEYFH